MWGLQVWILHGSQKRDVRWTSLFVLYLGHPFCIPFVSLLYPFGEVVMWYVVWCSRECRGLVSRVRTNQRGIRVCWDSLAQGLVSIPCRGSIVGIHPLGRRGGLLLGSRDRCQTCAGTRLWWWWVRYQKIRHCFDIPPLSLRKFLIAVVGLAVWQYWRRPRTCTRTRMRVLPYTRARILAPAHRHSDVLDRKPVYFCQ